MNHNQNNAIPTVKLLEALLNPGTESGKAAEMEFKGIPLPHRIAGLLDILCQSLQSSSFIQSESSETVTPISPHIFLACVLLRRDVSSLGSWVWLQTIMDDAQCNPIGSPNLCHEMLSLISSITKSLLEYFILLMGHHDSIGRRPNFEHLPRRDILSLQRLIGHVIAEACSCETWLYPLQQLLQLLQLQMNTCSSSSGGGSGGSTADGGTWSWTWKWTSSSLAIHVLNAIGASCSAADKASLDLLAVLAQRASLGLVDAYGCEEDTAAAAAANHGHDHHYHQNVVNHGNHRQLNSLLKGMLQNAAQSLSEDWGRMVQQPLASALTRTPTWTWTSWEMHSRLEVANSVLEAMTCVCRASEIWHELQQCEEVLENLLVFRLNSGTGKKGVRKTKITQHNMMQMVQLQTKMCYTDNGLLDSDMDRMDMDAYGNMNATSWMNGQSLAVKIGSVAIVPLMDIIHNATVMNNTSPSPNASSSSDPNASLSPADPSIQDDISTLLQTLSQMASLCPTLLLAGNISILRHVCLVLQSIGTLTKDELRLGSIQVLVTLMRAPSVKYIVRQHPHVLQLCIHGDNSTSNDNQGRNEKISGVIEICAESVVRGVDDDVESWGQSKVGLYEDVTVWEDDDVALFAQELLEDFMQSVGGSQCLSAVLMIVESLFAMNQWQASWAALCLLEICLISAPSSFAKHVPIAVEAAIKFSASDECVRVQFQAIQLLTALCIADETVDADANFDRRITNLEVRKRYGRFILECLAQAMTSKCTKVVGHGCLALVAYCRGGHGKEDHAAQITIDQSLILPYLGDILGVMENGPLSLDIATNVDVFIRAFRAIACLAYVAKDALSDFYFKVMPGLKKCAEYGLEKDSYGNYNGRGSCTEEIILLRGVALETASVVGQAVGEAHDIFLQDAEYLMRLILVILERYEPERNASAMIPVDQLLAASARIASVMKNAYTPYLPKVLPFLLHKIKEGCDATIVEGEDNAVGEGSEFDEDTGMETITMALPGLGVKKLVINTIQIQEKAQAARAVHEYARSLGSAFGPYAGEFVSAFLPLLRFRYSADVRSAVAQALDPVFESACEYVTSTTNHEHPSLPHKCYSQIVTDLAKQLAEEDLEDVETIFSLSEAISNIAYSAFSLDSTNSRSCMTCVEARYFVRTIVNFFEKCLKRRDAMTQMILKGPLDENQSVQYENSMQLQSEILTNLVDTIGYTLKTLKELFIPVFEEIVCPFFSPFLSSSQNADSKARFGAICLFDDCVEYCGSVAADKYGQLLVPAIIDGITDVDLGIREASTYGIAQIARRAPSHIEKYAQHIIRHLVAIAKEGAEKNKADIENIRLVENSASALATLTIFKSSPCPPLGTLKSEYINIFLANLPLQEDCDEAKFSHEGFCDLVESGEVGIEVNLGRVLQIIGEIASAMNDGFEIATMDTCRRFASIFLAIRNRVDESLLQQIYSDLSSEAQNGLNVLMEGTV